MLVEVVQLRRSGLRLRPGELDVPVRGELAILDVGGQHSSLKRATRVARLYDVSSTDPRFRREALRPLFDAQVIRVEGPVITIAGMELEASPDTTRTSEHGQVWRCTVISSAAARASP